MTDWTARAQVAAGEIYSVLPAHFMEAPRYCETECDVCAAVPILAALAAEAYQHGLDDDGRIHEFCNEHGVVRFDARDGSELSAAVRVRLLHAATVSALRKYSTHEFPCQTGLGAMSPCTCGLNAALRTRGE